jgi:hypothetical protein
LGTILRSAEWIPRKDLSRENVSAGNAREMISREPRRMRKRKGKAKERERIREFSSKGEDWLEMGELCRVKNGAGLLVAWILLG